MVRALSEFIVVSPDKPGGDEPVMAIAPRIFETDITSQEHLVQLPPTVGGVELFRGVVLQGLGRIFQKTGAEVMPENLEVVRIPGQPEPQRPDTYQGENTWD